MGIVVHLCRDLFESLKSSDGLCSVVLSSRLSLVRMIELDDEMNYIMSII